MTSRGERVFARLLRLYPREFRARYRDELLAFFRQDRDHSKYGTGWARPLRFWTATIRDLVRAAAGERRRGRTERFTPPALTLGKIRQDVRFAWRGLWASPGVTVSALLVLTLGIGAGTAIFSVVDAVVLRGLPFPDDGRLMAVNDLYRGRPNPTTSQSFFDWRGRQGVFIDVGAYAGARGLVLPGDTPEFLRTSTVTANLMTVLEVQPELGRGFSAEDVRPGAEPVALISHALWRRRFAGSPSIVGRALETSTGSLRIVGVMPATFSFPLPAPVVGPVDVWTPIVVTPALTDWTSGARAYSYSVVGRLKPGVTMAAAASQMSRVGEALASEHPTWFQDRGVIVRPLRDALVSASVQSWMLLLLGAVAVVLLLACLNAANLLVARAVGRGSELAVRAALGASRWDIARSLLVESLILSILGAAGGLAAATWGVGLLRSTLPGYVPRLSEVALDGRVLVVAVAAALGSGLLFGTLPALQASRPDLVTILHQASRGHSAGRIGRRFRAALVVAEVALAVLLLAGAGLFLASFVRVTSVDLGFDPRRVVTLLQSQVNSGALTPPTTPQKQTSVRGAHAVTAAIAERLRAVPGVVAVAVMQGGKPLEGSYLTVEVQRTDGPGRTFAGPDQAIVKAVSAGYLSVLRATLVRGRWISDRDIAGSDPVVVLSDDAARRYFGAEEPVGRRLLFDGYERTVIGVSRAMRWRGPENDSGPEVFIPFEQTSYGLGQLLIRTDGDPAAVAPALVASLRMDMPAEAVSPGSVVFLEQSYRDLIGQRTFNMIILVLFGVAGVAIAAVGIYGLMSFVVEQRRREIGVRVALGAESRGILRLVLGRALRLLVIGLVPGMLAALALERIARAFLFDARPHDPRLYLSVAVVLLVSGLAAAFVPARRATRMDPLAALRLE